MSCRSTPGGRAASSCATALTGRSADDASRSLHKLVQRLRSDPQMGQPATVQHVVGTLHGLAENVLLAEDVPVERRLRAANAATAAAEQYQGGDVSPWPSRALVEAWRCLPSTIQGLPGTPGWPYHLVFERFHPATLTATDGLFRTRPSRLNQADRETVFAQWVDGASRTYRMPAPSMVWQETVGGGRYDFTPHRITISPSTPSIMTLLHEFRHALQSHGCGARQVSTDKEVDARAWSMSLFHKVRPQLFERLVRDGRIRNITGYDLDAASHRQRGQGSGG